tara:strand:+ start:112 stop:279 length:168 start_codon:yes stop_codon:yes gene_type:complete
MSKLLQTTFQTPPQEYDATVFQGILKDIEDALTRKDFPEQVEGKEESSALNWFMG